jgi:hypothetical protein
MEGTMIRKIRSAAVAVVVVSAFAFGTFQLRGGETATCEGTHGPCSDQPECERLCEQLFPENGGIGICFLPEGCCMCAER